MSQGDLTGKPSKKARKKSSKQPTTLPTQPNLTSSQSISDKSKNPVLGSSVISNSLKQDDEWQTGKPRNLVIELNLKYKDGLRAARSRAIFLINEALKNINEALKNKKDPELINRQGVLLINEFGDRYPYLFAYLEKDVVLALVRLDNETDNPKEQASSRSIHEIWPDFEIEPYINKTISTIKVDAARASFFAAGRNIIWAVIDSGIAPHPHFYKHDNLNLSDVEGSIQHRDFTTINQLLLERQQSFLESKGKQQLTELSEEELREIETKLLLEFSDEEKKKLEQQALTDENGHGTHVAGIIAGELTIPMQLRPEDKDRQPIQEIVAFVQNRDPNADNNYGVDNFDPFGTNLFSKLTNIKTISGMAPECKLLSLKVLNADRQDPDGTPKNLSSSVMRALGYIQQINNYGQRIIVHGVNISLGYPFEAGWFACGQSPLCKEVDRLVRSGVVVVVAAGNKGYGALQTIEGGWKAPLAMTITDPGNATRAITVGSTHREKPHTFGVSYFSSKGPTGDGRLKPDLVAPGEKILSCATGKQLEKANPAKKFPEVKPENCGAYIEDSGTSMAAPHVSGAIAAFLSIRREFINRPDDVTEIFLSSATDLKRERSFQGHGLIDLMRAIQSV